MRFLLTICLFIIYPALQAADTLLLQSPDKKITATVFLNNGAIMYGIKSGVETLLAPAPLGIQFNDRTIGVKSSGLAIQHSYTIHETRASRINSSIAMDHCKGYILTIRQNDITDTIEFRLYDQGCAFRYLPAIKDQHTIQQELTGFTLPAGSNVWYFERNSDWKLKSYAGLWMRTAVNRLPEVSGQGPIQGKPLVVELPSNKYMVLSEAALYDYSGLRYKAIGNNTLQVNFTEGEKGFAIQPGCRTPWRVVLFAANLNELVNNKIIEQLNPKPDTRLFKDRQYIQPGRSVWSWITRNDHYLEPVEEKKFIDAASELHFEYTLIDDGWESKWQNKWQQLQELCSYAKKKRVGIWVWKHSKDMLDPLQRNRFLDSVRMAGAVGIKTDFMNSEAKPLIDFETGLLQAAAQLRLMVNFHGCQAPTGESVTYPNEMTREGIRGMELNIMKEPIPAWHNAALPFTRFICGHGDYTPGFFTNRGNTTNAHQLALLYLFNSPFQCIAENPVTLLHDTTYTPVLPLLKTVPVTWDETIVLPGSKIGALAAFARRKGNDWYVAVINGAYNVVSFELQPAFLPKGKKMKATVITDRSGDKGFISGVIELKASNKFELQPAGGLVIQIKANNK